MPFLLHLLALAVFAQGTSEFVLAGLLPAIAAEFGVPLGQAGFLTSAFAVGMAVGAPAMAAGGRRLSPRWTMTAFLALFVIAHVVGAVTGDFAVLLVSRVAAALANAGFLAVALSTVSQIVPAGRRARALAVILGGTTLALIAGVPAGALVGDVLGWRATLWAIAIICLPALVAVLVATPSRPEPASETARPMTLRVELAVLRRRSLRVAMVLAILVNGATFCTFTYLAAIATGSAGIDDSAVPALLALFGTGAFAGVTLAGRLGDRHWRRLIGTAGPLLFAGWVALALASAHPAALWVLAFTQGALSFAVGGALIARIMVEAEGAPTMSGSFSTAALNIGAVIGPVAGGAAFEAAGPQGIALTSAVLVGLAMALWWVAGKARRGSRPEHHGEVLGRRHGPVAHEPAADVGGGPSVDERTVGEQGRARGVRLSDGDHQPRRR
ncbi:DHA1 family chloramphenicol resistance protein-like MFS transporter [Myceligenerans xiligouense]|uniref:DHA1 family chloramphenicol resistance protein-like MFS transporter n=1 Tax=Myceligenerans xiligouense TaxID=253184 RepID=A0A3N4Z4V6_9MICO|nr:DHA1 family chloramphenicol resistance protein-like MFS transporter [Myceligenerans xiligouense]